jgi:UDP-glucose 4-epimerase
MSKEVLVVGGCGYIGSHMVECLLDSSFKVVVLDDLSTGYKDSLLGGELVLGSCGDRILLDKLFTEHKFDAVLHFASFIQVGESVLNPDKYYRNNTLNTLVLIEAMKDYGVKKFIFSSSAAVFGNPVYIPIDEKHPCAPINPYGSSKYFVECLLRDFDTAYDFRSVVLRYFNAAGADPKSRIGERHNPETHLLPLALQFALGRNKSPLKIFGNDYDTPDGTCIRDYIHVSDLCDAHLLALNYLWQGGETSSFNLGNGKGFSVQEIISMVNQVSGSEVSCKYENRRIGDPSVLIADSTRAREVLGWKPKFDDIETITRHAWQWELVRSSFEG